MKVTVTRSGGFAGLSRTWSSDVDDELVARLPWDTDADGSPDSFVYRITVSQREIVLPERQVAGPWRELVDRVCG